MYEKHKINDDELPVVSQNSPIKKQKKKSSFTMPDASVLAAQRKEEAKLEELVINMMNENKKSNVKMDIDTPVSNKTVKELYHLLFNEVTTNEANEVSSENPGIDLKDFNFDFLNISKKKFLTMFLTKFNDCTNTNELEDCLNEFNDDILKLLMRTDRSVELETLNMLIILFLILLVDKKFKIILTSINKVEMLNLCLKKVPDDSQTPEYIRFISQEVLKIFSHFHDRLYIAQCFETYVCCSNNHEKHSMLLGNRICKEILYCTLFDIIGCEYNNEVVTTNTFHNLKTVFLTSEKKQFSLYEHYIIILIICMLRSIIVSQKHWRKKKVEEIETQNWFLSDFNKSALISQNLDVNKIKSLCSQVKLLWN